MLNQKKTFLYKTGLLQNWKKRWYFVVETPGVVRSFQRCKKWILDKILHRYDDPIFFSTFIFSSKKNILKMQKNIFCVFKMFFFNKKIKVEKKIGSSYRCKILSGIHFSYSRRDLTTLYYILGSALFFCKFGTYESPPSETAWSILPLRDRI